MDQPTLIFTLFYNFVQTNPAVLKYQNLCTYKYREMNIFFMLMQFRRTYEFKAQHLWLKAHPEIQALLNFETVPDRTTLSRQYKKPSPVVTEFTAFVGDEVTDLDEVDIQERFKKRKTSVEPLFDLIANVIGTPSQQKQLPLQKLVNI